MAKLGLDYETLAAVNPKLVYCSISGFGGTGPLAGKAAYDPVIQAYSGMMTLTGFPENGPTKVGYWVTDVAAGIHAAYAISSALFGRERSGAGRHIDLSMLDAALGFISPMVLHYLNCGIELGQMGNGSPASAGAPSVYPTATNAIQISPATQLQFEKMCDVADRHDLKVDPRFQTRESRAENAMALYEEFCRTFRTGDAHDWEARMEAVGVPAGVVNTIPDALALDQVKHRGVVKKLPPPRGLDKPMAMVNASFHLNEGSPGVEHGPPHLGQHTDAVLADFGYDTAQIAALREDGVIG
jgi:formyl-CoA transferase